MKSARKNRLIKEKVHDPYYDSWKYPDGVICPDCHAIYESGHWKWPKETDDRELSGGEPYLCPSCRRIRDKYPAGVLFLEGEYLSRRRDEILNLVNHVLEEQRVKSPLRKVIDRDERKGSIVIQLTDDHLARHLGEVIHRAHKGDLKIQYGEQTRFVRVFWSRDLP